MTSFQRIKNLQIDCKPLMSAPQKEPCIDKSTQVSSTLTRLVFFISDYDMQFLVLLAPPAFRARAKLVLCAGFSAAYNYNEGVLGADTCSADKPCNPDRVSSFANDIENAITECLIIFTLLMRSWLPSVSISLPPASSNVFWRDASLLVYDFKGTSLLMFTSSWWLMPTMEFADLVLSAPTPLFVTYIDGMTESTYFPLCFYFCDVRFDPLHCTNAENALDTAPDTEKEYVELYQWSVDKFYFVLVILRTLYNYQQLLSVAQLNITIQMLLVKFAYFAFMMLSFKEPHIMKVSCFQWLNINFEELMG